MDNKLRELTADTLNAKAQPLRSEAQQGNKTTLSEADNEQITQGKDLRVTIETLTSHARFALSAS